MRTPSHQPSPGRAPFPRTINTKGKGLNATVTPTKTPSKSQTSPVQPDPPSSKPPAVSPPKTPKLFPSVPSFVPDVPLLSTEPELGQSSPSAQAILVWAGDIAPHSPAPPSSIELVSSDHTPHHDRSERIVIDGIEREPWEVLTQVPEFHLETDSDSHHGLQARHDRQIAHYKNLLVRAQSASSASLHELHTRLQELESRFQALDVIHAQCEKREKERDTRDRVEMAALEAISSDGGLRGLMQQLDTGERLKLLSAIVETCSPGDIDAQIKLLEKHKRSKSDILGCLPEALATRVLLFMDVRDILKTRLVCKRYDLLTRSPTVWKTLCRELEWRPWDGEAGLAHLIGTAESQCESTYRRLHIRDRNWSRGEAQSVIPLRGHTNFVTSLKLLGDTLVSGSYDESVRIWHLPHIVDRKPHHPIVLTVKAVSCLDFEPRENVIVVGTHDVGRVQIWRKIEPSGTWGVTHTLSGHLHGIRAVAINSRWLVSGGADKALVVWDWRTGDKIVRFGQQTNVCVNIQLVHDHVVAVTVDGVVRVFSIIKRNMVSQYKISELHRNEGDLTRRLQGVGAGVGGSGMITWIEGQDGDMICSTREMIIRLAWTDWVDEAVADRIPLEVSRGNLTGLPTTSTPRKPAAPSTLNQGAVLRRRTTSGTSGHPTAASPARTPRKPPLPSSPSSPSLPNGPGRTARSPSAATLSLASTSTLSSPTAANKPRRALTAKTSLAPVFIPEERSRGDQIAVPVFTTAPVVREIITVTDVERGAVDARRTKIVTSTRFAARSGADRQLYVAAPGQGGKVAMVPVKGAWGDVAAELGLQTPEKNPMSLVMDRDRLVYGCTDGTIVLVSFVPGEG